MRRKDWADHHKQHSKEGTCVNQSSNTQDVEMDTNKTEDKDKIEKVVDLLRKAMAGRSCRQYAQGAGISPAGLNKILNKKNLPTPATIKKLMSKEADPQGGVTLEDVMVAAGYIEATDEQKIEEAANSKVDLIIESSNKEDKQPHIYQSRRSKIVVRRPFRELQLNYEEIVKERVVTRLVKQGMRFTYMGGEDREEIVRLARNSLLIEMDDPNTRIKRWLFRCRLFSESHAPIYYRIYDMLGSLLFQPLKSDDKLTIVINDRRIYDKLKESERTLQFRGELSVIYMGMNDDEIQETYLSNYKEGDTSSEIYLA